MVSTVPIGSRRRKALDDFYASHQEGLGAAVGGSDCHFGGHDIASAITRYDGDFRAAIEARTTAPERIRRAGRPPAGIFARQQLRALIELPARRLLGQI